MVSIVIKRVWRATCIILQEEKGREAERRDKRKKKDKGFGSKKKYQKFIELQV